MQPELRALESELHALRDHPLIAPHLNEQGHVVFGEMPLEHIAVLLDDPIGQVFLMAAADLNRTALRSAIELPDAQIVARPLRRAHVVRTKLPKTAALSTVVELALQRRAGTLGRNVNAATETLFRDRLEFEGLPIRMRGAYTAGLLTERRKPDGVYPDPATGQPPRLYLEIKKINRVRDDIQKRLYEIAEVSLEMKFLYGRLRLEGLQLKGLLTDDARGNARAKLRKRIFATEPTVVALLLCRFEELEIARRYRPAAEAFVDRVFFADEIDDCISFLAQVATPGS